MIFEKLMSVPDLPERLRDESRPIFLYGTGNGADKILDAMSMYEIPCEGVFASDGFVRDRTFRGMKVRSYSDTVSEYGDDIVILCAFGSPREEVLSFLGELGRRHTLYIPEVPLFCRSLADELFTADYAAAHRNEIEEAYSLFDEEYSREIFFEMLAVRLSGDPAYLSRTQDVRESVSELVPPGVRRVIDCGAFRGDTASLFLSELESIDEIMCIEPDPRTFRHLSAFAESDPRCLAVNAAVGCENGKTVFMSSSSRASAAGGRNRRAKQVECDVIRIDETEIAKASVGRELFIKYDVEGGERDALIGSRETIARTMCPLSVALYHRTEDIFALPLLINSMNPGYRFRLRRPRCVPAWELTLYAI